MRPRLVAGLIAVWAALEPTSLGIGGAGRHALTVGFLMTMVFTVAPRTVPAFLGRKKLFSEQLMFYALLLTNSGCLLRVSSEIIAVSALRIVGLSPIANVGNAGIVRSRTFHTQHDWNESSFWSIHILVGCNKLSVILLGYIRL